MSFVRYTVHLSSLSLCFSLLHSRLLSLTQNTNNNNNSNSSLQLRRAAADLPNMAELSVVETFSRREGHNSQPSGLDQGFE